MFKSKKKQVEVEEFDEDLDDDMDMDMDVDVGDEDDIKLTDADLNDPELMASLKDLGYESEGEDYAAKLEELQQKVSDLTGQITAAKQKALSFKKEGKTQDAVQALRTAKQLEAEKAEVESEIEEVTAKMGGDDLCEEDESLLDEITGGHEEEPPQKQKAIIERTAPNIVQRVDVDQPQRIVSANNSTASNSDTKQSTEVTPTAKASTLVTKKEVVVPTDEEDIFDQAQARIVELKKRALEQKRAGDLDKAKKYLILAKKLELKLESGEEIDLSEFEKIEDEGNELPVLEAPIPKQKTLPTKQTPVVPQMQQSASTNKLKEKVEIIEKPTQRDWTIQPVDPEKTFPHVHENEIELSIVECANLSVHGSIYVSFEMPSPADSEKPFKGSTSTIKTQTDTAEFKFSKKFPIERKKQKLALDRIFNRKKITFEVYQSGFFRSTLIGKNELKLTELMERAQIHEYLDVFDGRKATGTKLEVIVTLRYPWGKSESPQITNQSFKRSSVAKDTSTQSTSKSAPVKDEAASHKPVSQPQKSSSASVNNNITQEQGLSDDDEILSVDNVVSNEVLAYIITSAQEKIVQLKAQRKPIPEELEEQKDSAEFKRQMLQFEVSSGKLTMPAYKKQLDDRVATDKSLALKFNKQGNKSTAIELLRRVKIMQKESDDIAAMMQQ